ncbi:MAG: histidine triad nucleotide-binding protein [Leptotrichiaceae bacterium]|nr:histidine triad nucleotide-binding protein [Leptotrichiaceae bacterium]
MSTIFKKIINKEIPSDIVYEDEEFLAFHDINPAAKIHILVIPKKEIKNLDDASEEDLELLGKLQLTVAKVARMLGIAEEGYRVITNINKNGGQEVYHIHYHILGGEPLGMIVK